MSNSEAMPNFQTDLETYCDQWEQELDALQRELDLFNDTHTKQAVENLLRLTQVSRSRSLSQSVNRYAVLAAAGVTASCPLEAARLNRAIRDEIKRLRLMIGNIKRGAPVCGRRRQGEVPHA